MLLIFELVSTRFLNACIRLLEAIALYNQAMSSNRFCRSCNQPVSAPSDQEYCPQCGDTLVVRVHHPTLEMETSSWQPGQAQGTAEHEEQGQWVGREVSHYRIEQFLGQGGMARVYLARHLDLDRPCAIKMLRENQRGSDDPTVNAFLAEARAAAGLTHPNVVTIHSLGELEGQHFIEMEFMDGPSLARLIEIKAPIDPLIATELMLQVSAALAAAHEVGIVHRDVKPANVMLSSDMRAKLADFGLAKRVSSKQQDTVLCGTPQYMAPELFRGEPASPRSDVYAMGVTYFSMLTGRLPVEAPTVNELVRLHVSGRSGDLPELLDQGPLANGWAIASLSRSAANSEARKRSGIASRDALAFWFDAWTRCVARRGVSRPFAGVRSGGGRILCQGSCRSRSISNRQR